VINKATSHEDITGEWRYSTTNSQPRIYMDASDKLHAPAALPPG